MPATLHRLFPYATSGVSCATLGLPCTEFPRPDKQIENTASQVFFCQVSPLPLIHSARSPADVDPDSLTGRRHGSFPLATPTSPCQFGPFAENTWPGVCATSGMPRGVSCQAAPYLRHSSASSAVCPETQLVHPLGHFPDASRLHVRGVSDFAVP
jgi:hypothetical protein